MLRTVQGRPLLGYLLDRVSLCGLPCFVATSTEPSDDTIADFCTSYGAQCRRGPLDDVAGRFMSVLDSEGLDTFVRICGDSPMIDPALIRDMVRRHENARPDLTTNVLVRTFPKGQSVEVLDAEAYRRAYSRFRTPDHHEHVTRYFYENADDWRIESVTQDEDFSSLSMAVDTEDDMLAFESVVNAMSNAPGGCGWREILPLLPLAEQKAS